MTIVITKGDNPGNYIYVDVNGWFRYICVCLRIVVSLLWFSSFCGLSFFDCPFGILERLFALQGHISSHPAFVGFVLINRLLCLFVFFVVFSKSLFIICPLSFTIVSTFRGFLSRYFFCTKQKSDYVFNMTYPYYFPGFTNFFCCILKVRWLFRMHFRYYWRVSIPRVAYFMRT